MTTSKRGAMGNGQMWTMMGTMTGMMTALMVAALAAAGVGCGIEPGGEASLEDSATAGALVVKTPPKPTYPNYPSAGSGDFGAVDGTATTLGFSFYAPAGTMTASITGSPFFKVAAMSTYTFSLEYVDVDTSDLPPGATRPPPQMRWVKTLDKQVTGGGPIAVTAGQLVTVAVTESATSGNIAGNLILTHDSAGATSIPLAAKVSYVKASLDISSLTIPQGRSGDIGVTIQSVNTPDYDSTFTFWDAIPGITITNPVVHVVNNQTTHAKLHMVIDRNGPLGAHEFAVAAGKGVGFFTVTVTPLPTQTVSVPLGGVKSVWDNARAQLCEVIKDQMGRAVNAQLGRTIRDPECSLAPLTLGLTRSGNAVTFTGSIVGNRVGAWVTTPYLDRSLDPYFFMFYDAQVSLGLTLPTTVVGQGLRVTGASVTFSSAQGPQSGNWTGDIAQAVAKALGYGYAFAPFQISFDGSKAGLVTAINTALAQLDAALVNAPTGGFTQIDITIDPTTFILTVHLS